MGAPGSLALSRPQKTRRAEPPLQTGGPPRRPPRAAPRRPQSAARRAARGHPAAARDPQLSAARAARSRRSSIRALFGRDFRRVGAVSILSWAVLTLKAGLFHGRRPYSPPPPPPPPAPPPPPWDPPAAPSVYPRRACAHRGRLERPERRARAAASAPSHAHRPFFDYRCTWKPRLKRVQSESLRVSCGVGHGSGCGPCGRMPVAARIPIGAARRRTGRPARAREHFAGRPSSRTTPPRLGSPAGRRSVRFGPAPLVRARCRAQLGTSTSPPRPPLSTPRRRDASRRSRPYTAITAGAGGLPFRGWAVPRGAGRRRRALRRRRLGRAVCGVAGIGTSGGGGVGGAAAGGGYVPKGRAARLRGGVAHSGGGGGGLGGGVGRRGRGRPGV